MAILYPAREPTDGSDSDRMRDSDEDVSAQSDFSDTSSDITELDQAEFPSYFQERNGHLFHSHGSSPYPLPVDTPEQQRLNEQHALLRCLLGAHYRGPVRKVLRPRAGAQRRVLDLCTGTGQWVLDMSREFPHVKFDGLDIVPIATRRPPDNVRFEMADVNAPFRYNNGTFDLVHARSISMAVRDYSRVVDQVARVLRPGGVFLACEWGRSAEMAGGRNPVELAPRTCLFYRAVHAALEHRAIAPVARHLTRIIQDSGQFERVRPRMYEMPIGDWPSDPHLRTIGERFRANLVIYAQSMGLLILESGHCHPSDVQELVNGFIHEMYEVRGLVCKYFTVRARKVHV